MKKRIIIIVITCFLPVLSAMALEPQPQMIDCDLVKGKIPNHIVSVRQPISLEVSGVAYSNLQLIRGERLGSTNIQAIHLNLTGSDIRFVVKSSYSQGSFTRLDLVSGNQLAFFYINPTSKKQLNGFLMATQLESGDTTVEYNVSCRY